LAPNVKLLILVIVFFILCRLLLSYSNILKFYEYHQKDLTGVFNGENLLYISDPQEPVPLLPIPNENEVPDQNSLDSEKEIHNVGNTDNNQNEVGEVEIERMQV